MHVVIAGAGIGGLTLALALAARGIESTLVERNANPNGGAGIQLSPNATRVLDALGCLEALSALATEPRGVDVRTHSSGVCLTQYPLGAVARQRFGYPYLNLLRSDLIATLRDSAGASGLSTLVDGVRIVTATATRSGAGVVAADGRRWDGDLVVGADGVNSACRGYVAPGSVAELTGHVAWRALVAASHVPPDLPRDLTTLWCGPGAHLVHYFVAGGDQVNLVGVVERDDWPDTSWRTAGTREAMLADFHAFRASVRALIGAAKEPWIWALADMPPMPAWSRDNVTLLGDACHPMLPFAAQGAAQAIEDAWVLARELARRESITLALERYEAARRPRTAEVSAESTRRARLYHRRSVREGLGALVGSARGWSTDELDWLYGYDATSERQPD